MTIPATVQISDLTAGTTVDGTELFEAIQTSAGVARSVKLTLTQMFGTASLLSAPYNTTNLAVNGLVLGQGTGTLGVIAAAATGLPLVAQGTLNSATFTVVGLAGGGFGTTTLTAHGVVLGNGSAVPVITAVGTAGQLLVGQNATNDPSWKVVSGDITLTAGGVATVAANAIDVSKLGQIAPGTLLGNPAGATTNVVATSFPILGTVSVTSGIGLRGQTSGIVNILPQQTAGTWNFNLPTSAGTAGQVLVTQGGTTTAQTWTGVATGVGWGLTGSNVTSFSPSVATVNPAFGFDSPVNLGITASTSAGVLTVGLVSLLGTAPSATSPILVPFRNTTLATGVPLWAAITATTQVTTVIGASLGAATSTPTRFWVILFYTNATTVIPALINCSNSAQIFPLPENTITSTIGMTATSTLAGVFYSNTTASASPYRILGYMEWTAGFAVLGTYSSLPTVIQPFGPGIKRPGEQVQVVAPVYGSLTVTTVSTALTSTLITASITPSSPANFVRFISSYSVVTSTGTAILTSQVYRATVAAGNSARTQSTAAPSMHIVQGMDAPGTSSATTYVVRAACAAGTATIPAVNTDGASLQLVELMG